MDWSERYATPLNDVFSRRHKLALEWRVELALLKALGENGLVPREAHDEAKAVIECERQDDRERARPRRR
jgi:adenylosuccinate lyase